MLNYQRVWLIRTLHIHTSVKNEHGYLTYRKSPVLNFANQWKTSIDYKWVIFHSYVKLAKGNKRTGACLRCARYSPISFAVMKNCDVGSARLVTKVAKSTPSLGYRDQGSVAVVDRRWSFKQAEEMPAWMVFLFCVAWVAQQDLQHAFVPKMRHRRVMLLISTVMYVHGAGGGSQIVGAPGGA